MKAPRWTREEYERYEKKRGQVVTTFRTPADSAEWKSIEETALVGNSKMEQLVRLGRTPCLVKLTRVYTSPRLPYDDDRLAGGFARLRDICAGICGFKSDRAASGIQFEYSQEKGTENKVVIKIYEKEKGATHDSYKESVETGRQSKET